MNVTLWTFIAFVALIFVGVIVGKSIDESEDNYIGKD